MAGKRIDELPDAGVLNGSELAIVETGGIASQTTTQDIANLAPIIPPTGVAIGDPVGGATPTLLLFTLLGLLAEDPGLRVDSSSTGLKIDATAWPGSQAVEAVFNAFNVALAIAGGALRATDGVRTVFLADGTNAITYVATTPTDWAAAAAPTDVWLAIDRIAAALTALGQPP